jgi:hypothetical protein
MHIYHMKSASKKIRRRKWDKFFMCYENICECVEGGILRLSCSESWCSFKSSISMCVLGRFHCWLNSSIIIFHTRTWQEFFVSILVYQLDGIVSNKDNFSWLVNFHVRFIEIIPFSLYCNNSVSWHKRIVNCEFFMWMISCCTASC